MSQYTRRFGASPAFQSKLGALAAGASTVIDYESDSFNGVAAIAAKYLPLNFVRILNNSSQSLDVYLNQNAGNVVTVAAGQDFILTDEPVRTLKIVNLGSSGTNANEVIINGKLLDVSTQDVVKAVTKKVYGGA
jgi:hypothetical protein